MSTGLGSVVVVLLLLGPQTATQDTSPADADRGCCVWKTDPVKCAYATRAFCRTSAEKKDVEYTFHKDKKCKDVQACPKSEPERPRATSEQCP